MGTPKMAFDSQLVLATGTSVISDVKIGRVIPDKMNRI